MRGRKTRRSAPVSVIFLPLTPEPMRILARDPPDGYNSCLVFPHSSERSLRWPEKRNATRLAEAAKEHDEIGRWKGPPTGARWKA
jgi:hypothetical protein